MRWIRKLVERRQEMSTVESLHAHLAAIVDSSDDAIIGKDHDGIITSWNAGAERLYGYTAHEAIGESISLLLPEGREDEIPAILDRLRRGERVDSFETVRQTKDGRRIDVSLTVSPIRDRHGRTTGASAVARDITARKRAEQAAEEELRDYRRLQEISCRLIPADDIQQFCKELVEAAIAVTHADRGTMQALDADTGELRLLEASGFPQEFRDAFARVPRDAPTSCAAALRDGTRVVVDYADDSRVAGTASARAHLDAGIRAAQSTPLVTRSGRMVGMLSTHWNRAYTLPARQTYLLDTLARQAADLIERAEAEEAVRESARRERVRGEQFETLLDQAPMGVCLVDGDFRVAQVNPAAEPMFAGVSGGVIGRDFGEVLRSMWGSDRAAELETIFRRTLESGQAFHAPEFAERRADRQVTEYYDWRVERIALSDGRFGAVCYFREISEQVLARRAIAESEARYRTLFESIDEGFCILEVIFDDADHPVDFRYVEINPAFERQTGMKDALGRTIRELVPDIEPFWLEIYGEIALTGVPVHFHEHARSMGRWFEVDAFRVGAPDQPRVAVLFTDVSERKQHENALRESEERLRLAKAAGGLGIHDYNVATGAIEWDERTREIWGVGRDERITLELWLNGIHPDDRRAAQTAVERVLDPSNDADYFAEYRVINGRDGNTRWVQVTGKPTFVDGEPVRLVGTVQDITDRMLTVEALEESARRKDEFLATLSHELRNPLAAIRSALHVLGAAEGKRADLADVSAIIDRQSSKLVRLIDDLLDVSRISSGKVKLEQELLDLVDIVRGSFEETKAAFEKRGLKASVVVPERPIMVAADPVRLAQVVNNLLHNACKFTPRGGEIQVIVGREDGEGVIRVTDTGSGMPPEQLTRIFEMFAQVDASLSRKADGLGIGLSLAKSIVELHGGSIAAKSDGEGKGSEFIVRLRTSDGATRQHATPDDSGSADTARRKTGGRRVVLAEDNLDLLQVVAMLLRKEGHDVVTAADGLEALEKVRTERPDVALLDIGMPGMNGYDVARRIRAEPWGRNIMLIAMTGWGQGKDKRMALEAGFDKHLTKPVDAKDIHGILRFRGE
jgi:PAS domain S-box-containing protein